MDRSRVKAIVDASIDPLLTRLGIGHWRIEVGYDLREGSESFTLLGRCRRMPEYNIARIELDADALDDEQGVMRTLRHELMHIVLAPFDLYRAALQPLHDETAAAMAEVVWVHSVEKAVVNLERMYAGLTAASE